mgnify:FL=1
MATESANHFKYKLAIGDVGIDTDSFKIILMNNSFTFNKDTHATYADVSASELATANGYTVNTKTLAGVAISEDDTNDRAAVTWSNVSWTASGGSIGPSNGAIIFDDTTVDDTVVGYLDFGAAQTATDGGNFNIINVALNVN